MQPADSPLNDRETSGMNGGEQPTVTLRLYVARSTPNSVRAERNLTAVLETLKTRMAPPGLEIVDVFRQPTRAITDGVIVTPTLIGLGVGKRVVLIGDLADRTQLENVLADLSEA